MNDVLGEATTVGGDDLVDVGYNKLGDLHRIYAEHKEEALQYRKKLEAHGFDTSRFQRPVLIRRRVNALTPEERAAFIGSSHGSKSGHAETSAIERAYGPTLARFVESSPTSSVVDALWLVAEDWRRLRLAATQGAPWMEVTPALRAAVIAIAHAQAVQGPVAMLIFEGSLAETGLTEAAYGFLRLMHADAALTQVADAATIAERLKTCILSLETQDEVSGQPVPSETKAIAHGSTPPSTLGERAATLLARAPSWSANPLLETARLSATTDFDALRQLAALNDLPAIRLMKWWLDSSGDAPEAATRTGIIAEMWLSEVELVLQHQLVDPKESSVFVEGILSAGHNAFAMEALAFLARHRAMTFDGLDADLRASFVRHGVDDEAWRRIGRASSSGMIDPALLDDGDMERVSAVIADDHLLMLDIDQEVFPVSRMVSSFAPAVLSASGGPFAAVFPTALAMTAIGILVLQLKSRMQDEMAPDLRAPQPWISAFLQSGAAGLIGQLMARIGDAVDGFAHGDDDADLGGVLAHFLQASRTGGAVWYARRGADRLLWEALQRSRGRDIAAAYARMSRRYHAELSG